MHPSIFLKVSRLMWLLQIKHHIVRLIRYHTKSVAGRSQLSIPCKTSKNILHFKTSRRYFFRKSYLVTAPGAEVTSLCGCENYHALQSLRLQEHKPRRKIDGLNASIFSMLLSWRTFYVRWSDRGTPTDYGAKFLTDLGVNASLRSLYREIADFQDNLWILKNYGYLSLTTLLW